MKSKFTPIMIKFDKDSYEAEQLKAKQKLEILDEASVWIHNTIEIEKKINLKRLHLNMVEYFKDALLVVYKDQNTLGLSAEKLIEAKEFKVNELAEIQNRYEANNMVVKFSKNYLPSCRVERKDFETYTENDKQNTRLLVGNNLIAALNALDKHHPTAKLFCNRLTNGYVNFDMHRNGYYVNPEMLKV